MSLIAFLSFARANWRLILVGLVVLAILMAAGWIYGRGRADEQARQNAALMKAYEQRTHVDEDLAAKSPRELCLAAGGGGACGRLSDQP